MKNECCDKNPLIGICGVVCGVFLVIAVLFLLLAKEQLGLLIPMVWAFVVIGIVMGAFAVKSKKK